MEFCSFFNHFFSFLESGRSKKIVFLALSPAKTPAIPIPKIFPKEPLTQYECGQFEVIPLYCVTRDMNIPENDASVALIKKKIEE